MAAINRTGMVSAGGFAISTVYTDYSNWFTAAVTLTNTTGAALSDWTVVFDPAASITALWGGVIARQSSPDYVVTNAGWNAIVPSGGSVTFNFNANGPAPVVPARFVLNGATLGVAAEPVTAAASSATPLIMPTGVLQASMAVTQDWGSGWNGMVTITDGGATVSGGWTIGFDLASTITNLWDGVIVSHAGTHYVVANAPWDATLAAAKPVTFGFNAQGARPMLPTGFVINGAATGTPVPPVVVVPSLSVMGGSVTETPSGTDERFTVTLSQAAASAVSFAYATQDGTALAGTDYTATYGTATIAAGQTTATILVPTRPGRTGSAAFALVLGSPIGATLQGGGSAITAVGTIVNTPSLSVSGTTVTETGTGATNAMFAIQLSGPEAVPVTVAWSTVSGIGEQGALAGRDFTAGSGTVTIAAGATDASVAVPTFAAGTAASRSFTLVLSDPTHAAIANGTARATLVSAAPPPVVTPPAVTAMVPAGPIGAGDLLLSNVTRDLTPPQGGAAGALLPGGYLHTNGNQIVSAAGQNVRIQAVSWYGLDNTSATPGGLDTQNYKAILDRMVMAGFNTLRLPFSNAFLAGAVTPAYINTVLNPDLAGLSGLALMDRIVAYAGQIGLKVILDDHNSSGTSGPNTNGLWYDQTYSDARWQSDWAMLAGHYAGNATVIGADLFNEPHSVFNNGTLAGATWGDGSATDWAAAATRAGNAIQAVNPNWLIVVEGIQAYQGTYTNWGANLMGVARHPVTLADPNHVVYSAHTYPASVDPEPWFNAATYPANLATVWTQQFGYIAQQGIAPVFIGEYGANFSTQADQQWLQALQAFTGSQAGASVSSGQLGMSMSYWAWNAAPGTPLIGLTQMDYATANTTIQLAAQSFAYHGASPANELDIPVSLAAPHTAPVTIAYATQDGTAQAGTDYVAASGTISFAPGETAKIVPALLLNPAGGTGNLSFLLKLSDTAGRALGTETVTIQHDPQATVTRTSQQWSDIAYNTVTINNTSGQTINGWEVAVHTASSVLPSQVYDGQLVSASGNDYLFTSASWNQKIAPGGSAHFEFGATQTAINTPVSASVVHTGY